MRSRRRLTVTVIILGVALAVGVFTYRYWMLWPRLERAADRFPTPTGFEFVRSVREGTTFCPISCDEARITKVYRASLSVEEACTRLRQTIDRNVGATMDRDYLAWCGYEADLNSVSQDASVRAGAAPASELRAGIGPSWKSKIEISSSNDTVAWVEFSSGLD